MLIHGDANLRNALLLARRHGRAARPRGPEPRAGGGGPRAGARRADRQPRAARANALLRGYGDPPDEAALRWHTAAALLARQALPAVSRYRPDLLARLRELLDAGSALLAAEGGGGMKPALLFYCQHSVGLGHLMRSYALTEALAERFRVVLLAGGELPDGIEPPRGVEIVALPPLGVNGGTLRQRRPALQHRARVGGAQRAHRARRCTSCAPAASCSSSCSRSGARSSPASSIPLLEQARALGATTACSLRDILVSTRENQHEHDDRAAALANAHLDLILVHCDPALRPPGGDLQAERRSSTSRSTTRASSPATATGAARRGEHIVVSAGGGRVGRPLLEAGDQGLATAARCARSPAR